MPAHSLFYRNPDEKHVFFFTWPNQQIKSLAQVQCGEELDIEQNI